MTIDASLDVSPETTLRGLVNRAARSVQGCCGATSSVWIAGVRTRQFCSHPDLSLLLARERELSSSPMRSSARTLQPSLVRDTLTDTRWPRYSVEALRLGVRSLTTSVVDDSGAPVTLTLFSLEPDGLATHAVSMGNALIEEGLAVLRQASRYDGARREAHHLAEAIAAREIIEQAKGMIMQAMHCDAVAAFDELVRTSQRGHLKIVDVAQHLVDGALLPGGPVSAADPPAPGPGSRPHPSAK